MKIIDSNSSIFLDSNSKNIGSDLIEKKDRFDIFMENRAKEKAEQKERKDILENIESVVRTGFTKEEIEAIQQNLEAIQQKRAKSGHVPQSKEEALANQKADLQEAILKATGKTINLDEEAIANFMQQQNSTEVNTISTNEHLRLLDELKNR